MNSTAAKHTAWISLVITLMVTVCAVWFLWSQTYDRHKDIEAVAHRAQVAADAEDMLMYMSQLKANMEKHGMTEGHTALFLKDPSNDLRLLFTAIVRITQRLEQVKDLDKSDAAYQVAMDDLRGTIRELEPPTDWYIWVHYWYVHLTLLIWLWPIVHLFRLDF